MPLCPLGNLLTVHEVSRQEKMKEIILLVKQHGRHFMFLPDFYSMFSLRRNSKEIQWWIPECERFRTPDLVKQCDEVKTCETIQVSILSQHD